MTALQNLAITVRLHDGRYHGTGEWRPSPARLFQALIAGAARGSVIVYEDAQALEWLESLRPPTIGAPVMRLGQRVETFVPNNDIDAVGGDFDRVADIRSSKVVEPKLFDREVPFLYVWTVIGREDEFQYAHSICELAEQIYQFGRGVDMAWARGEVVESEELEKRLFQYPGLIYRPSDSGNGRALACPERGSLASLAARHSASAARFTTEGNGKSTRQLFSQAPKARFTQVAYESPPSRRVYELRSGTNDDALGIWPLKRASALVVWLRDGVVKRLQSALPEQSADIESAMVGRMPGDVDPAPRSSRVKIIPLPSIGHPYADRGIRRVLVEVPSDCALRPGDAHWAFSGIEVTDSDTGEVTDLTLTPSSDVGMLRHYGIVGAARAWRTVTPAALPDSARRRRIDPARVAAEAKDGAERAAEEARAVGAVIQALRHAGKRVYAESVRVQREPFEAKGERVEAFAPETRFAKERLWHVEIAFDAPVKGPLVIGDGRFLGLGVMAPVHDSVGIHAFLVEGGLAAAPQATEIARALRRAVMARIQDLLGSRANLPTFFTGHERDGSVVHTESHPHLTFTFDPVAARLLIIAPHVLDRRDATPAEAAHLRDLDAALVEFRELRAGPAGLLSLHAARIALEADPLFAASTTWENVTPYQVTRHAKQVGAAAALSADLRLECRRRGLPEPHVAPRQLHGVPDVGLVGGASLTFKVGIKGPIILGRSRHLGGGLFAGTPAASSIDISLNDRDHDS